MPLGWNASTQRWGPSLGSSLATGLATMVRQSLQRTRFLFRALTRQKLEGMDLLESDHIRVELLFLRWRLSSAAKRAEIFGEIRRELIEHMRLEETRFYPECENVTELMRMVAEAYQEHRQIKMLLKEISGHSHDSEGVRQKMRVLMEEVENHIYKEENSLFPRVRVFMKRNQLLKLSRDLRSGKVQKNQKIAA